MAKFESLVNQIQKNARDINQRLNMIENSNLFKFPTPKAPDTLPGCKVRTATAQLFDTLSSNGCTGGIVVTVALLVWQCFLKGSVCCMHALGMGVGWGGGLCERI